MFVLAFCALVSALRPRWAMDDPAIEPRPKKRPRRRPKQPAYPPPEHVLRQYRSMDLDTSAPPSQLDADEQALDEHALPDLDAMVQPSQLDAALVDEHVPGAPDLDKMAQPSQLHAAQLDAALVDEHAPPDLGKMAQQSQLHAALDERVLPDRATVPPFHLDEAAAPLHFIDEHLLPGTPVPPTQRKLQPPPLRGASPYVRYMMVGRGSASREPASSSYEAHMAVVGSPRPVADDEEAEKGDDEEAEKGDDEEEEAEKGDDDEEAEKGDDEEEQSTEQSIDYGGDEEQSTHEELEQEGDFATRVEALLKWGAQP